MMELEGVSNNLSGAGSINKPTNSLDENGELIESEKSLREKANDAIKKRKDKFMNKLGVLNTICNIIPAISGAEVIAQFVAQKVAEVVKFLLEIMVQVLGIDLDNLKKLLTSFMVKEINIFSNELNYTMTDKLKGCFLCKLNPIIPNWLIDEGINLEIDSLDFRDMFKIHPNSEAGKMVYGDDRDMNRFLFNTIQSGEEETWTYNNKPIAHFKFIEKGGNVGYIESKDNANSDNKGQQNYDSRNNVINMKIDSSFRDNFLVNFINDYIRSLDPIIQSKKVLPNLLSKGYGVIPRTAGLSIFSFKKQVTFDLSLEILLEEGAANDDEYEIDNTYTTFTQAELDEIEKETNNEYNGIQELPSCCCGQSSVSDVSVVSFNERLNKTTTEEGEIEITNNALDQISRDAVKLYPVKERNKGFLDFFSRMIAQMNVIITGMVLTPKINFIIVLLNYMITKDSRFISVRDFFKVSWCIIKDIVNRFLTKLVYGLILPLLLKRLMELVKCGISEIIKKKITDDLLTYRSIIPGMNKRAILFAKLVNALRGIDINIVQGITSGLANGAVDSVSDKVSTTIKNKE